MATSSSPVRIVYAVVAAAPVSWALAGGEGPARLRRPSGPGLVCCQAWCTWRPKLAKSLAEHRRSAQCATISRSLSCWADTGVAVPSMPRIVLIQCWAASICPRGACRRGSARRSVAQYLLALPAWVTGHDPAGFNTCHAIQDARDVTAAWAGITQQDAVLSACEHPRQVPGQQPPAAVGGQAAGTVAGAGPAHRQGPQVTIENRVIEAAGWQPGPVLDPAQDRHGNIDHHRLNTCGACQPSEGSSPLMVRPLRRASASSQLSRLSLGMTGTPQREAFAPAAPGHKAAIAEREAAGRDDSCPSAKEAASCCRACSEASSIRTVSSSRFVSFSSPVRIAWKQPRVIKVT